MPIFGERDTQITITENGKPVKNLELKLYVLKEEFYTNIDKISQSLTEHENSSHAHDEHIEQLIDRRLNNLKKELDDKNQTTNNNKLTYLALIISALTLIWNVFKIFI